MIGYLLSRGNLLDYKTIFKFKKRNASISPDGDEKRDYSTIIVYIIILA